MMPVPIKPLALMLSLAAPTQAIAAPDTSLYGRLDAACSGPRVAACPEAFEAALASLGERQRLADLDATLGLIGPPPSQLRKANRRSPAAWPRSCAKRPRPPAIRFRRAIYSSWPSLCATGGRKRS
jgi:hypothetical protein